MLVNVLDHGLLLLSDRLIRELARALVRLYELLEIVNSKEGKLSRHLLALGLQAVLDPDVDILYQVHKGERTEHLTEVLLDTLDIVQEDLASVLHGAVIQGQLYRKVTDLAGG